MKKEYMKPMAEKIVFDYAENVFACSPNNYGGCGNGNGGGTSLTPYDYDKSFPTRDVNQINYECHEHYADAEGVCGQNGKDYCNPFYVC